MNKLHIISPSLNSVEWKLFEFDSFNIIEYMKMFCADSFFFFLKVGHVLFGPKLPYLYLSYLLFALGHYAMIHDPISTGDLKQRNWRVEKVDDLGSFCHPKV
jgi:hypothetical protein